MEALQYIRFESIDSTNSEAKRMIGNGTLNRDTVIIADHQTSGRGRLGRSFYSPAGSGLYMTVVLKDMGKIEDQVTITTRTAVAAARAIYDVTGIDVKIKWVNDLYIDKKKIAGILCEAVNDYENDLLQYVIIGIGINLSTEAFPEELSSKAGSLFGCSDANKIINGSNAVDTYNSFSVLKNKLAERTADEIFKELKRTSFADTYEEYRRLSNVIGRKITFIRDDICTEALAVDIDDIGGLIVEYTDASSGLQKREVLNSGEISIIF